MASRSLLLAFDREAVTLGEVLDRRVDLLRVMHRNGDPAAAEVLDGTGGKGTAEGLLGAELTLGDARLAIARDHGYPDWDAAREHADVIVDTRFEAAADAIHSGEMARLRDLIDAHPALISMRSPYPHHCMLLHYVAANGIEIERQLQSPPNAPEIMRLLLDRGAEPDAACDLYGGGRSMTTMCLLVSSCVPAAAGVQAALVEELCRGGAAADGPENDGAPLRTAIMFGYTEAAEALVRGGARVDNLIFHAALGDLAAVESCFGADGALVPAIAGHGLPDAVPAEHLLDYALISAAAHGRLEVAEFLLSKDPDLSYTEPFFGATARGAASYSGSAQIVALIEERLGR